MSDQPKDLPASMLQPVTFHGEDDDSLYCERHGVWHVSGPEHSCEAWEINGLRATLARAREMHQATCPLATGAFKGPGWSCSMCEALAEPEEQFAGPGGNAEDCPVCSRRRDIPYPFICQCPPAAPGGDPRG